MTLHKAPLWLIGLVQAAIVLGYILSFAFLVINAEGFLGDSFSNPILGMSFFLTAFVFSALVCGGTVLGYPLVLLFEKNVRRAIGIICWSMVWFAAFLGTVLAVAVGIAL